MNKLTNTEKTKMLEEILGGKDVRKVFEDVDSSMILGIDDGSDKATNVIHVDNLEAMSELTNGEELQKMYIKRYTDPGDEKPAQTKKCNSSKDAVEQFFGFVNKYPDQKIELYSANKVDRKKFYSWVQTHSDLVESLFRASLKFKQHRRFNAFMITVRKESQTCINDVIYPFTTE